MSPITKFNPQNPTVAGLEWHADQMLAKSLRVTPGQVAVFNSTKTESIDAFLPYLDVGVVPANAQFDIYDTSNVDRTPFDVAGDAVQPIHDIFIDSAWDRSNGGTQDFWIAVNEIQRTDIRADDPILTADFIKLVGQGVPLSGQDVLFQANTTFTNRRTGAASDPLTNRRILSLRLRASAVVFGPGNVTGFLIGLLKLSSGNATAPQGAVNLNTGDPIREITWEWLTNPRTALPWTISEIQDFASGVNAFGARASLHAASDCVLRIYNLQMEVVTTEDRRVAYARRPIATSSLGWQSFPILSTATDSAATWGKVAGKQYAVVGYSNLGALSWRALIDSSAGSLTDHQFQLWDINSSGIPAQNFSQTSPPHSPAACAFVLTAGGSNSPDSQPYAQAIDAPVTVLTSVQQEIDNTGTLAYGQVSLLARPSGPTGGTADVTAPLQVSLRRRSDSALLAGPIVVQASEVPVDGQMHLIERRFASAPTLAAGTQYYVEATSATLVAKPWLVTVLSTTDTAYANITYKGSTDAATRSVNQGSTTRLTSDDAPFLVKTVPPALSGLTAISQTQTQQVPLVGGCTVSGIRYAHVAWNPSSLGGTFFCYEISRLEGMTWVLIARITAEANSFFNDFELHRNLATQYRTRVVRADGAFSDWSVSNQVSVAASAADILLVSNAMPDLNVGYQDTTPHTWAFPDADALVLTPIYGQDNYSAFRPTERRGDKFTKTFIVAFNDLAVGNTVTRGRTMFNPLENIAHSVLVPYVCVADGDGNRWYTAPKITSATRTEPLGQYFATVDFAEVNGPDIVTTSSPWGPGVVPSTLLYGDPGGVYGDAGGTYGTV